MMSDSESKSAAADRPPQTRREAPNAPGRSPDSRFGRETGRESPIRDSAGSGNREIPRFPFRPQIGKSGVSTAGTILDRELEIPRFPIRPPGPGIAGIAVPGPGGTPGISWSGPPAAPHANTATRAPSTLRLPAVRAAGF